MILPRLIAHHLKHGDDPVFYRLQAQDAIVWLQKHGVIFDHETKALDLGCGHGWFGAELQRLGCQTSFSDIENRLAPALSKARFIQHDLDRQSLESLGRYDLVISSNVLEHLKHPKHFLQQCPKLLQPHAKLYLSWTNWLSPWGGHDFSPFHYLGARRGHLIFDKIVKRKRRHTPYLTLYPTYIGKVISTLRQVPELTLLKIAPRYYPELSLLTRLPIAREFLTWNCAILVERTA